jgi:hypothetical protein
MKVKGICKVLKWKVIPETDDNIIIDNIDFDKYKKSKTWSSYLEEHFGKYVALSFVNGSAWLLDEVNDDLDALSKMPKGSHIGEIHSSFISPIMPEQFLVRYDYEFMFAFRQALIQLRKIAPRADNIIANRVIDELILYLIVEEAEPFMEDMELDFDGDSEDDYSDGRGWVFNIFDDMDIVSYLYSNLDLLEPDDTYHFQFYVEEREVPAEDGK